MKKLIEKKRIELEQIKKNIVRRKPVKISNEEFKELFLLNANIYLTKQGEKTEYKVDENNKDCLNQLFYYLICSDKFNGDLDKGICLVGGFGTGKTVTMNAYVCMLEDFYQRVFYKESALMLPDDIVNKKLNWFAQRPMFIDELGKEKKEINDYGTKTEPTRELFTLRYNKNAWTFATANYKLDTFNDIYSEYIKERMIKLFNFIELKGDSRRV